MSCNGAARWRFSVLLRALSVMAVLRANGEEGRPPTEQGFLDSYKSQVETASRSANPCSLGDSGKQTANTWSPLGQSACTSRQIASPSPSGRSFYLSSSLPMSRPAFRLRRRRLEPEHIYSPHLCSVRACAPPVREAPQCSPPPSFLRFPVPPSSRPARSRRSSRRGRFHRHPMRQSGSRGRLRMNVFKKRAFQAGP